MAKCSICGAETELYVSGKPICLVCDEANNLESGRGPRNPKEEKRLPRLPPKKPPNPSKPGGLLLRMLERSEIERILHWELERARLRYDSETTDFRSAIKGMVPIDANFPDETVAIRAAGTERRDALEAYGLALKRFTAFIIDGIVPEDLKK